jgi:hypothetical protein
MARWSKDTLAKQQRSPKGFGQHVRSYVEGRGVVDERTGITGDFHEVLDGDLDAFLKGNLAQKKAPPG